MSVYYDPFSHELHEDPYPVYKRLRDEAPAYFNPKHEFWALSRYADVRAALKDPRTFCSGRGILLEDIDDLALPMIVGMDPPDHTRLRDIVKRSWTPRRIAHLEAPVRKLARSYLDGFASSGRGDIMADFAGLLPMAIISEILSVPEKDRDMLRMWADELVERDDGVKAVPEPSRQVFPRFYAYFEKMIGERGEDSRDDLLGLLIAAERQGELTSDELLGFCFLLIVAGNETTMRLIGNAVYQLSRHPEQRSRLIDDPSLIRGSVEEVLRYDSSVHFQVRTLTRDVELHGERLKEGQKVALLIAAANRDERQFADPDRFDVGRDASGHLGFGIGLHFCLGSPLARLETMVSLQEILSRIPDFEVDLGGLEWMHSSNVRGFSRVPITFTPAP
jgi:cytochrome P450